MYKRSGLQLICIMATIALIAISCKKKPETTYPSLEKITNSVYASGTVKSNNQYQVFAKANGVITSLLVKEGDHVKKGQVLLSLANDVVKLNYENAKLLADYSSVASNNEKLQQAQNELAVAKLKLSNEQSLLERQRKLWAQEIGTQNELDQRVLTYENALSNFNASKLKVNDLQKQINFQSQQTHRTASISAVNLNDYLVKSNIDGVVYSLAKETGEMVTTQSPIAVIGNPNRFYLDLQVDEYDIAKIKAGQKIVLTMDSYRGQVFEAVVTRIYPLMNEKSKSFKVEASFTTQPSNLYPNLSAEANIIIEVKERALTIPRNYLLEGGFVLIADNKKTKVTTGLMDYNKVEIISGITEKDQIFKPLQ